MYSRLLLLLIVVFIALTFIESSKADGIQAIESQVETLENNLKPIPSSRYEKNNDPKSCADSLHKKQKNIALELKRIKRMIAERNAKK
jgi:hypothetical protein